MMLKKKSLSILATCLLLIAGVAGTNYVWGLSVQSAQPGDAARTRPGNLSQPQPNTLAETQAQKRQQTQGQQAKSLERPSAPQGKVGRMLQKTQFLISYNVETRCPNYVCWSLTAERAKGRVQRSNNFHADTALEERQRVESFDYNGSGYDRGHMCPAGDNKNAIKAMDESFCMTNICPQNHQLNVGLWNDLEMQCRSWARSYGTLYICCGPIFDGKTPRQVGRRKDVRIAVPDRFFKVVLKMGRVPKAIGFIYPNRSCQGDMRDYAVSVDEVERVTGFDFFHQLDDKQEKELEKVCNPAAWGI